MQVRTSFDRDFVDNDWYMIVVRAMAEDILGSFEPEGETKSILSSYLTSLSIAVDLDNDGIAESGGKLQLNQEVIIHLLPQEERERRQKEARQARIAIIVNVVANVLLVVAKGIASSFSSSLSLIASLADSVLDLLSTSRLVPS